MSTQTILHKESPLVAAFTEAGAGLADLMLNHFVSNYTLDDVQQRTETALEAVAIDISPIAPEDPEAPAEPIVFDATTHDPQQISLHNYRVLKSEQSGLFNPPVVEPPPEPRYQTKNIDPRHFMEMFQSLRKDENGVGEDVLASITLLARQMEDAGDPTLRVWLAKEGAGPINIDHPEVVFGLAALVQLGKITQDESEQLAKGLLLSA